MSRKHKLPGQVKHQREEWVRSVEALVDQVQSWAEEQGWTVRKAVTDLSEEALGSYQTPMLEIDAPQGRLVMEPIARDVMGASGRIDLYAYPTLYRVMLLRMDGADPRWVIRTDSGLNWPQAWERSTFVTVAEGLLGAS